MGKGTKHASDWKETTLQVILDAKRLYTHSVKIMGNEKVFKEIRRRMIRLAHKIKRGECDHRALSDSYQCVRSCMEHGNSARLLRRMDDFYNNLEKEIDYASKTHTV